MAARRRGGSTAWWPVLAVAAVAAVWLAARPGTADMAAHAYRAWLWETEGFTVWNNQWYGGHHVPGYSLLFPPLAALLGPWLAVAAAGTFAAYTLTLLTREWRLLLPSAGESATRCAVGAWVLAAGAVTQVLVGRGPFVLGVAFGALALALLARGRGTPAALAALACVWSSPVAGMFLALIAAAHAVAGGTGGAGKPTLKAAPPIPVLIFGATVAGGAAMILPFPEGGAERFVATAFWPMLAVTLAAAALIDPRHGALRLAAAGYVLLLVAAFAIDTPVGQNATRLGTLAGPAVLALAGRGPKAALLLTGAALLYLQWLPAVRAIDEQRGDPSTQAAFHAPLLAFLDERANPGDRVEIPLTRNHWEATHVAKRRGIARGWERQLDVERNALFYTGELSAARYEQWLRAEQIRWVAVPDAPLDFSARQEAELIRSEPPFLTLRERLARWTIYETGVGPSPIVAAGPTSLSFRRGAVVARRFTRFWRVAAGAGCVREAPGGRTETTGPVRLQARLSGPTCR